MNPFPAKLDILLNSPPAAAGTTPSQGKDTFDAVWKIVEECGEEERHFNQLQSVYRGVASTWLIATLGAVGYLLFNKDTKVSDPHFDPYFFAAVVCFLGAVGIALIWILDLRVYHRLLVAVFEEGRALETHFKWLPQFRNAMHSIGRTRPGVHDPVRRDLAAYYVGTTGLPLFLSVVFCSFHLRDEGWHWYRWAVLLSLFAAAVLYRFFSWTSKT